MLNKHYRLKSIQNIAPAASGLLSRIGFSHLREAKWGSSTMVPVSWTTSAQRERFPDIDHSPHFLHVCVFSSVTPGACHQHLQSCGSCKHNINLLEHRSLGTGYTFVHQTQFPEEKSWARPLKPNLSVDEVQRASTFSPMRRFFHWGLARRQYSKWLLTFWEWERRNLITKQKPMVHIRIGRLFMSGSFWPREV